ncbi:hypothetical protein BCR33DRAFT_767965 [Rhizoclosmatium globosum]|uniref:NAD(P)-binding protein n=1 Tax=Rhizoclosmatium globosum TaxID=329046 RepID=A0A1Y2C1E2_9FUNG|nr:hypothetical protein BCR33DRAFT_767965 [Rhizoclosmatium globosum]|eukprot:ORY40840.1 hypothetical protein BCR33DRAFT_767965 [Rhizoclosmatium globosum]
MGITTFSASSTAEQVAKAFQSELEGEGKTILITGGNTGLGLETAKQLAGHGATVILTARSETNGQSAIDAIKKVYPTANVVFYELDLASLKSVKAFAVQFLAHHTELNILINNVSESGYAHRFCSIIYRKRNLLKNVTIVHCPAPPSPEPHKPSFSLSILDKPDLPLPHRVILTRSLKCAAQNVISVSLHPGAVSSTDLKRHIGISNIGEMAGLIFRRALGSGMFKERFKSIPEGASTTVLCALSPDVVKGGYYYDFSHTCVILSIISNDGEVVWLLGAVDLHPQLFGHPTQYKVRILTDIEGYGDVLAAV